MKIGSWLSVPPLYLTKSAFHRPALWLLAILYLLSASRITPAETGETIGVVWTGEAGITESVRDIMGRELAEGSSPHSLRTKRKGEAPKRKDDPNSPKISQWPAKTRNARVKDGLPGVEAVSAVSPVSIDKPFVSALSQSVGTNFTAAVLNDSGFIPPDSMGAVGPSQILVVVNGRIRSFTKGGVADGALNISTDLFFNSVRVGSTTSDPRVVFDRLSQRWFVSMMTTSAPNRILIAVSSGSTISSASSFTFFPFEHDLVGTTPNSDAGQFADQPSLGVDNNALYIGVNIYNSTGTTYRSSTGFVVNKANLLGGTLTVTAFRQMATTSGPFAPLGVTNMDPAWTEGYFIGTDAATFGTLQIRRISNPGGTPSISGNLTIGSTSSPPLPATTNPISVPAKGSTPLPLDGIDDRLMNAQMINGSLWATHSIQVDATGTASSTGGRDGMRFYQITNMTTTPSLVQAGTLFDSSATNPLYFWVGSIATSGQGHSILASSYAGKTAFAGVAFDGRLSSDTPGVLNPAVNFSAAANAYNVQTSSSTGVQRWGDYSNVFVDPTDNMTMWSFQEFTNATNSWGVHVTQLKAPPPATPSTASPLSAPASTTQSVTITGVSTGGSSFYDPSSGFPNHISATVNGGGVTVNNVAYTDPIHITLSITIASNAAQTPRTVTVTNPDGQSVTSSATFTITAPELITLSPSTASLPTGTAGVLYSQTLVATGGIAPYTYSISAGNLPAGLSLNGATGIISGTPTTSGSQTFTVQAKDAVNGTGSTQYTLQIANRITNNFSLGINSTSYDPTPSPGYVGKYTVNTTLTNNGSAVNSSLYLKMTALYKNGTDLIPSQPITLLSADNGAGVVGDTQQIVASLGAGQATLLNLLFGIGSRQSFNISFDIYTILPGSAITAASNQAVFKPEAAVSSLIDTSFAGAAATALPGSPVLIGQFQLRISDDISAIATTADSVFNADPVSNVGIITGPGPQSRAAVAVDPIIPTHIAVASNDYATRTVRVSTTQDGGVTWHATTLGSSVLNQNLGTAQNPSLAFDSRGRLSVVYTLANPFDSTNAVVISESTDGINFSSPTAITFHPASERIVDSRPVIATKADVGRYIAWDSLSLTTLRYSINLVRSVEGGILGPVTTVVSNGLVSSPALALSESTVYLGWDDWGFNSNHPYDTGGRLVITSSPIGPKLNFERTAEIARTSIGFGQKIAAMPEKGVGPNLSLAADTEREDVVYAVFADKGNGMKVRFARSLNRGKTWQQTTINNDGTGADQFSPAIAVDANGNIFISFGDTRLSSTFETSHVFLARSPDGKSFQTERITTASSNDSKSNPQRDLTGNLGDRTALAISHGEAVVVWTDTRLGSEDVFGTLVFDPHGAFVTGSGEIISPAGAYTPNASATGTAEFGFEFKYKKNSSVPRGDTEFSFVVPQSKVKLKFQSTSYDSLVITGATAQFKGSGKLDGGQDCSFIVTLVDGDKPGGGGIDRFRIKIVAKATGAVVYDNVPGAPDQIDAVAPAAISEGKIKIVD